MLGFATDLSRGRAKQSIFHVTDEGTKLGAWKRVQLYDLLLALDERLPWHIWLVPGTISRVLTTLCKRSMTKQFVSINKIVADFSI
jgi:hypothetical protein